MNDPIQAALATLLERLREQAGTAEELEASATDFFASGAPQEGDVAARLRHLEWFVLERPSAALGDVPLFALREGGGNDSAESDALGLLGDSRVGMFAVGDVRPGEGFWLRDLLGHGELPVREATASAAVSTGDLVVGRVYGDGDGAFLLSPAAAVFHDEQLVAALRADAERARAGRRGALRIAQSELERMFFSPGGRDSDDDTDIGELLAPEGATELPASVEVATRVGEQLTGAGWDAEEVARLSAILVEAAHARIDPSSATSAIADVLDRYAFEGEGDIERLRLDLATWWAALQSEALHDAGAATASAASTRSAVLEDDARAGATGGAVERPAPSADAREALEAFDRGRAEGRDLGALFAQLERDLGLKDDADEDPGTAPDFPGVVGAMVEEFLWERSQRAAEIELDVDEDLMRTFAARQRDVGVFEELDARALLEFATRTAIEDELCAPDFDGRARLLLDGLEAFARWADREHDLSLWIEFEPWHASLRSDLGRTSRSSRRLARPVGLDWSPEGWAQFDASDSVAILGEESYTLHGLPDDVVPNDGDLLVGRVVGARFEVAALLPPVARELRS